MRLEDKALELKPITLEMSLQVMRDTGHEKDADEMRSQVRMMADMTNWTEAELLSLELTDWPKLVREFGNQLKGLQETALPPESAPSSDSGPAEPDKQSQPG